MNVSEININKPYKTSIFGSWKFVYAKGFSGLGRSSRSEYWGFSVLSTLLISIIIILGDLYFWGILPLEVMLFVPIAVFWLLAVDNFSILIVLGLGFTVPLFEGISIDTSFILFLWIITLIHLILKLPLMVRRLGDLG